MRKFDPISAGGTLKGINYLPTMRRLFLILMIVLLPLRAWAGDMMAVGMVTVNPAAQVPCAGHDAVESGASQHATDSTDPADINSNAHCETCVVCQICHSVALASLASVHPPSVSSPPQPASNGARFASAPLVIGLKPPIS